MIYARNIKFEILDGKDKEFTTLFNNEILPLLKKQEGFREEMVMVKEHVGVGISLWNSKESLEKYNTTVYPDVAKKLTPVLKGQPMIDVYHVTGGTINMN